MTWPKTFLSKCLKKKRKTTTTTKSLPRMKERKSRLQIPSQVLKTIYTQIEVDKVKVRVVIKKIKDLLKNQMIQLLANRIAKKVKKNSPHYLSMLKVKRRKVQMRNLRFRPGDQVLKIKQMQQPRMQMTTAL